MNRQAKTTTPPTLALACLVLAGGAPAAGQEALNANYTMKPPDVSVPADVPAGQYRRIIQPFKNWILICDENLKLRRKICNITQAFLDAGGRMVFSWSLAADEKGKPFMILRVPATAGASARISLAFAGRSKPVTVAVNGCDASVCIGYVPVGPILREQIRKEAVATVSYPAGASSKIEVKAPFGGLSTALSAIN